MMKRLEYHVPAKHKQTLNFLSSGTMPDLLYHANMPHVNPAILYCMHANRTVATTNILYLPHPEGSGVVTPHALPAPNPICSEAAASNTPSNVEATRPDIGIVWWLFDADKPYLAEVFENGNVPNSRLPHLDRSMAKGNHLARILGCTRQQVKVVSRKATMCLYTIR
jgi:hypothetical protein